MTEGIIQKAYRKVSVPLIIEIDDVDVAVIPQTMVDEAFKELIKEIKQHECTLGDSKDPKNLRFIPTIILLGDTRE